MPWHSIWPIGNISVKANRTAGNENFSYIKNTMGGSPVGTIAASTRDHFWDVGSNEDGRHRFIQSPPFVNSAGAPANPNLGAGMGSVLYCKTSGGQPGWFARKSGVSEIYQFVPTVLSGVVKVPENGSYKDITLVPADSYGYIFLSKQSGLAARSTQTGFFTSTGSTAMAWSYPVSLSSDSGNNTRINLQLGNGSFASGLNILVRVGDPSLAGDWNYKIVSRVI